jgi:hypothetical protein
MRLAPTYRFVGGKGVSVEGWPGEWYVRYSRQNDNGTWTPIETLVGPFRDERDAVRVAWDANQYAPNPLTGNPMSGTEWAIAGVFGALVVGVVGYAVYATRQQAALSNAASAQVAAANAQGNSPASLNPDAEPPFVSGT